MGRSLISRSTRRAQRLLHIKPRKKLMTPKKPVLVLLEDDDHRATWLGTLGKKLGFAVWWSKNVQDFHQFVFDAKRDHRLFMVIMDHDLGHKDGKDSMGEDGRDAAENMDHIGATNIIIWSHNHEASKTMHGYLKHKTDGAVRAISFTEATQNSIASLVQTAMMIHLSKQRMN